MTSGLKQYRLKTPTLQLVLPNTAKSALGPNHWIPVRFKDIGKVTEGMEGSMSLEDASELRELTALMDRDYLKNRNLEQ